MIKWAKPSPFVFAYCKQSKLDGGKVWEQGKVSTGVWASCHYSTRLHLHIHVHMQRETLSLLRNMCHQTTVAPPPLHTSLLCTSRRLWGGRKSPREWVTRGGQGTWI